MVEMWINTRGIQGVPQYVHQNHLKIVIIVY